MPAPSPLEALRPLRRRRNEAPRVERIGTEIAGDDVSHGKHCAGCGEVKRLRFPKDRPAFCTMRCAADTADAYPAPWEGRLCNDCGQTETDCDVTDCERIIE